jgi:hypothetical protein
MTIGTLSRSTGVPVKQLREYADQGLIYTVGRSPGKYRLFGDEALWCVRMINDFRPGPDRGRDARTHRAVQCGLTLTPGGDPSVENMDKNLPQTRPRVVVGSALCGSSPPRLPADTPTKRHIDRLLPWTGLPVVAYFGVVIALVSIAPHLPTRPGLLVLGLAAPGGGSWCSANYRRFRHAHCLVTGVGQLALGGFALVEAAVGRSELARYEPTTFAAILAAGLLFELVWRVARGMHAVSQAACRPQRTRSGG